MPSYTLAVNGTSHTVNVPAGVRKLPIGRIA